MRPGRHPIGHSILSGALALILGNGVAAGAVQHSLVEDFSTTTFKDATNTTADWNTSAGKLQLFPFATTQIGVVDPPGSADRVAVAGSRAYVVGTGVGGLQVIDISNPIAPAVIGSLALNEASNVTAAGPRVYVADGTFGVRIVNATVLPPTIVGSYNSPGFALDVFVSGTTAYVADHTSGLRVVNVTNPALPVETSSFATAASCRDVVVSGKVAYVACATQGLLTLDLSVSPPSLLDVCDTPDNAWAVAVTGNFAYVADRAGGLQVIDVTDPANTFVAGSFDTPGLASDVAISGDVVYVADGAPGVEMFDVTNPASPVLLETYVTPEFAAGVAISGTLAYVPTRNSGMRVLRVGTTAPLAVRGTYDTPGIAVRMAVSGDLAYLADGPSGLRIVNVHDPSAPVLVGSLATTQATGVALSGTVACVADGATGVRFINVTNPAAPSEIRVWNTPGNAFGVAISGNAVLVADGDLGLRILTLNAPGELPAIPIPPGTSAYDVEVSGNIAYILLGPGGLRIADITNPAAAAVLTTYPSIYANGIAVDGNRAYLADGPSGLKILDVTNPAAPALLGSLPLPAAQAVAVAGTVAYVTDQTNGVFAVDVSNPASPAIIDQAVTGFTSADVAIAGSMIHVTMGPIGLRTIEVAQRRFDLGRVHGYSLALDALADPIRRARVTESLQTSLVTWELSPNGGANWYAAPVDTWVEFPTPASDLRWKARLTPLAPYATAPGPDVTSVKIEWLYAFPALDAIADIPNDQGHQVRISWTRSAHDYLGDALPIVEYAIYRRIEAGVAPPAATLGRSANDPEVAEALAEGWDFVAATPAEAEDRYSVVVPTLRDWTIASPFFTTFKVRARTATPGIFIDSNEEVGTSIDNLAPSVPAPVRRRLSVGCRAAADLGGPGGRGLPLLQRLPIERSRPSSPARRPSSTARRDHVDRRRSEWQHDLLQANGRRLRRQRERPGNHQHVRGRRDLGGAGAFRAAGADSQPVPGLDGAGFRRACHRRSGPARHLRCGRAPGPRTVRRHARGAVSARWSGTVATTPAARCPPGSTSAAWSPRLLADPPTRAHPLTRAATELRPHAKAPGALAPGAVVIRSAALRPCRASARASRSTSRYQSSEFCGFSTQWFSSGK